jgi:hypothetical protein
MNQKATITNLPKPLTPCQEHGHSYRLASNPYRKVTGERRWLRIFGMRKDKSTRYVTLFCTQCADVKEILQIDQRFGLEQIKSI